MTRPRESILNMFDPLNRQEPSTSKRDELSMSPESDKENLESNMGELTAFFSRTYSRKMAQVPDRRMKRLIDVGEVTVIMGEDGAGLGIPTGEGQGGEENADNERVLGQLDIDATPRYEHKLFSMSPDDSETPMQRAPFQDITPETTPVRRNRTFRRDEGKPSLTDSAIHLSPRTTLAPPGSPLASVINSINFGDDAFASTEYELPQISISFPSRSAGVYDLASSTANLIPSASSALLIRTAHLVPSAGSALITKVPLLESVCRPLSPPEFQSPPNPSKICSSPLRQRSQMTPTTSKHISASSPQTVKPPRTKSSDVSHTRTTSTDLHSSFNVQLETAESSFDLLNDRISFFDSGMGMESSRVDMTVHSDESLLIEEFDLKGEEARMIAFLGTQKSSPVHGDAGPANSTPKSAGNDEGGAFSSIEIPMKVREKPLAKKPKSSPESSIPSFANETKDVSPVHSPPKSEGNIKPNAPRRSIPTSAATSTPKSQTPIKPAFAAPRPVPALRIVKRANNATAKPSSTSHPSLGARIPLPLVPIETQVPVHKPALKGVQRPRPSKAALVAPRGIVGLGSRTTKPAAIVDGMEKPKLALGRPISSTVQTAGAMIMGSAGVADGDLPAVAAPKTLRRTSSRLGYGGAGKPAQQTISSIVGVGVPSVRQPGSSRLPTPGSRMIGKVGSSIPGPGSTIGTGIGRRI